ncbi:ubiquitin-conjugating enzyme E2 J2 isoform X1 [Anomalospiza imberbis]|uniref:ubiquitin-conjugating enzyme E2 J2 isoform X1 n=1 Tax=Anomalospiza imberbis TaxID=187417 RepID=UPI00358E7DF3
MSGSGNKRAPTTATQRLKQDYLRIKKDPVPYICAEPLPSNILEWHYVVRGPELTPYEGGYYHGKLIFPREFPFKPPSIYMITPNGRFKCNTRLCLSITDFHPDTWNPAWSVSTILTGLLSFMVEKGPTLGSIETSEFTKRQLAAQSLAFNLKDKVFCELFPEVVEEMKQKQKAQDELSSRPPSLPLPKFLFPVQFSLNSLFPSNKTTQIPPKFCFPTPFPLPFSRNSNKSPQIPQISTFPLNFLSPFPGNEAKAESTGRAELQTSLSAPPQIPFSCSIFSQFPLSLKQNHPNPTKILLSHPISSPLFQELKQKPPDPPNFHFPTHFSLPFSRK